MRRREALSHTHTHTVATRQSAANCGLFVMSWAGMRLFAAAAVVGLLFATRPALAEPASVPDPVLRADVSPPPPADFARKRRLSDEDLARKKEDGYFTGLPLANYDADSGFGAGARAYYYWDGKRTDPLFAYTPYEHRVFAQAFASTGGLQFHWLDYDAPALGGTPWRVRTQLIYVRNTSQNYFGIGERGRKLRYSGAPGATFDTYESYAEDQARPRADGTTYALYDKMLLERPLGIMSLERTLLGGVLRSLVGFGFMYNRLGEYSGKTSTVKDASGADVELPTSTTRFREDCAAGLVVGCGGGWDNTLRLGLAFDTRDFEPDPNAGIFADLAADFGTRALGSQYEYVRAMLAVRGYWSPFPKTADLVLAARGVYQVASRGAPFFSMNVMPFTEDPRTGMGGARTMRGFKSERFVGPVMALGNFELRWTFAQTRLLKQQFGFMVVPFLDMGRTFDQIRRTSLRDWDRTQGVGFRVAWNLATIVMVDYGRGTEDSGLYINFAHIF